MASPQSAISPKTPGSMVLRTPLSDEAIWKRLREAGFDEESIKRRDKASLIAYIAKLEAEVSKFSSFFAFVASSLFLSLSLVMGIILWI